jgi:hypothetical protein
MRRTKGACSGMKTRATIEERVQQSNALVKVPGEVKE